MVGCELLGIVGRGVEVSFRESGVVVILGRKRGVGVVSSKLWG